MTIDIVTRLRGLTYQEEWLEEAADEIERLRIALKRFGLHTWDCAFNDSKGAETCDCGWAAIETELSTYLEPEKLGED